MTVRNHLVTVGASVGVVLLAACSGAAQTPQAGGTTSGLVASATDTAPSTSAAETSAAETTAAATSEAAAPTADAAVTGSTAAWPLYRRNDTQSAQWVAGHRSDKRAATIASAVASRPTASWFTQPDPTTTARGVDRYLTSAVAAKQLGMIVLYALPNRDCGGASAGGTRSASAYRTWVNSVAGALRGRPVVVIVEPDSLALQTCLSGASLRERNSLVAYAAATLRKADPAALIYLDAGHSSWNPPAEAAKRLRAAGLSSANGFFTNVSNYRTTSAEVSFGAAVRKALGSAATGKNQVIDTSRNGNGPRGNEWCDPPGRKVGQAPARRPRAGVDAYLWVKPPGDADGCAAGAGQFVPDLAYKLALGR